MILFEEDWEKHPGAFTDLDTTNTSFVRTAQLFKDMGVRNHDFLLAIHNEELLGIDPHAENLSIEIKSSIVIESIENPWYFIREVAKIPPLAGADYIPFRANRANIALYWLFFNHITTLLIQPRQTGKSVSTDVLMVYLMSVMVVNTDISLLTKNDSLRLKNIKRLKDIITGLPDYFNMKSSKDVFNTEEIAFTKLGNAYRTAVGQISVKAALNLGRGMTNAINHIDEFAYISNIRHTLSALLAASGAARDAAETNDSPYGNIFTTTPGYLEHDSGKFAHTVYTSAMPWNENLYDTRNLEELKRVVQLNSKKSMVVVEMNHRQLGYTDEWLKGKIRDAMSEGDNVNADFLNLWPSGNTSSPISKVKLEEIKKSVMEEIYTEITEYGYVVSWYITEKKIRTRTLVLGLDTSDAIGSDDIFGVIRDVEDGSVVATGIFNETNLISFSEWLGSFLIKYPNITLIIEKKSSGVVIIDNLIIILTKNGINPLKRLFNWVVNDREINDSYKSFLKEISINFRDFSAFNKVRKQIGYATSATGRSSRDNLYGGAFNQSINYTSGLVNDKVLARQLTGLIKKNGRIDHSENDRDDGVIAWLLSFWMLTHGKNLSYYGIDTRNILNNISNPEENIVTNLLEGKKKDFNNTLKVEYNKLTDILNTTVDRAVISRINSRLAYIQRNLGMEVTKTVNTDNLIEKIESKKNPIDYFKYFNSVN